MNTKIVFEIAELALAVAKAQTGGKLQEDVALAGTLLNIVQKAVQAYQQHTGERIDPSLVKAEPQV
jgi:hypothetical protein